MIVNKKTIKIGNEFFASEEEYLKSPRASYTIYALKKEFMLRDQLLAIKKAKQFSEMLEKRSKMTSREAMLADIEVEIKSLQKRP